MRETLIVSSRGQITLPANMRKRLGIATGSAVIIEQRDGGRFAVFRFAGRMNSATSADAEHALLEWIDKRGWKEDGEAEFAGYDPPWTPGFLRRNEVLIRLK